MSILRWDGIAQTGTSNDVPVAGASQHFGGSDEFETLMKSQQGRRLDIGALSQISNNNYTGVYHVSVPVFSKNLYICDFRSSEVCKNSIVAKCSNLFLYLEK